MDPNNWDLDAVVRGCCFAGSTTVSAMDPFVSMQSSSFINEQPSLHRGEEDEAMFMSFPYLSESRFELDDLYKPFIFGNFSQPSPPPPQQEHQQPRLQFLSSMASHQTQQPTREIHHRPVSQAPKSKRRKNQLKKVVCQIPAEGVSPDMWAWRKYGQKPIKGSPYPRGYYRCSSSKGCPARKQVERSVSDAGMLVVTYTGEHNHPIPTHRNSLAGSTRQKLPPPPSSSTNTSSSPPSTSDAAGLSPITPLTASMEDELLQSWRCKGEGEGDDDYHELMAIGGIDLVGQEDSMFLELEKNFLEDGVDGIAEHFR